MYECNIIEAEDFGFNHFLHHIDEDAFFPFDEEFDEKLYEQEEDSIWE
jgi:hypothetical protein